MAYYNQDDPNSSLTKGMNTPEEDPNQKQSATGQPMSLTTQSATVGNSAAQAQSAPTSAAPKQASTPSSGMGTGFQNYAKANQGNAQNTLNQAVAKNVQAKSQIANSSINQANTSFQNKIDQGSLANRQQAVQDVNNITNAARNVQYQAPDIQTQLGDKYSEYQAKLNAINSRPMPMDTGDGSSHQSAAAQKQADLAALNSQYKVQTQTAPSKNTQQIMNAAPSQFTKTDNIAQGQSELSDDLKRRFEEVINAKYQGPESLRQAGLYQGAADKVSTAQNALDQTKNALGRQELLRNMYESRGDYTRGLNNLDSALLNQSQQGVQNLQNVAKEQGNVQNKLDQAQLGSAYAAQNRANEIGNIRQQAMNTFSEGKKAEETATDNRLNDVVANWDKLPQHFKDIINNKGAANQQILDAKIADYNKTHQAADPAALAAAQKAITQAGYVPGNITSTYLRSKMLASQQKAAHAKYDGVLNQQKAYDDGLNSLKTNFNSNQVALNPVEAAILGVNSGEGIYNMGADAIKTGVADKEKLVSKDEQHRQAALAQLAGLDRSSQLDTNLKYGDVNKAGTQSALDALDLAGTRAALNEGEKNFQDYATNATLTGFGAKKNKTNGKRYYAQESANLGNLLKNAGYNFGDPASADNAGNADLLKRLSNVTHTDVSGDPNGLGGAGSAIGDSLDFDGKSVGENVLNLATFTPQGMALNAITGALGLGNASNAIAGALGFGGANTAESKADAAQFAREDLQNKIKGAISSSGFQNRIGVESNTVTDPRVAALQQLLANLDKTNT
jgi:hypothetical protein